MKIKILTTILLSTFIFLVCNAQSQGDRVSSVENIRFVTDAVSKHNAIYTKRVKGHESEQGFITVTTKAKTVKKVIQKMKKQ